MARVQLKGLNRISKRLADGSRVTYHYAWKGGPRLPGQPGSPEFMAAWNAAIQTRRTPTGTTLRDLVARYRAAPEFTRLAPSTRREWDRWLDRITATSDRADQV